MNKEQEYKIIQRSAAHANKFLCIVKGERKLLTLGEFIEAEQYKPIWGRGLFGKTLIGMYR